MLYQIKFTTYISEINKILNANIIDIHVNVYECHTCTLFVDGHADRHRDAPDDEQSPGGIAKETGEQNQDSQTIASASNPLYGWNKAAKFTLDPQWKRKQPGREPLCNNEKPAVPPRRRRDKDKAVDSIAPNPYLIQGRPNAGQMHQEQCMDHDDQIECLEDNAFSGSNSAETLELERPTKAPTRNYPTSEPYQPGRSFQQDPDESAMCVEMIQQLEYINEGYEDIQTSSNYGAIMRQTVYSAPHKNNISSGKRDSFA